MDAKSFKNHLTDNIINFWNTMIDIEHGGSYGLADCNGVADKKADKGIILNNRILWFYSSAYMLLKDKSLLESAKHTYAFIRDYCVDKENGGVFWSVTYDGQPMDDNKHTYNQAFAIYALSTYYEATRDESALDLAFDLYEIIENKCKDEGGYLECFNRDFTPASNEKLSENGVMADRTMNTLLHVLEAYTVLYKVSKEPKVKKEIMNALDIFADKIYNKELKRCEVFFDYNYNTLIDLESFGHDIEASWLIKRACDVIDEASYTDKMMPIVENYVHTTYKNGMNATKNALFNEMENGVIDEKRVWWVQAEAIIGYYNLYQINNEYTEYLKAAEDIWQYVNDYVVEKATGEWRENTYDDEELNKNQDVVHEWKCPYHNGRMCIEMVKRIHEEEAKELKKKLEAVIDDKKVLFGHQNSTWISVNSKTDSDVRDIVGVLPAIMGIDTLALSGNESTTESPEAAMKKSIEVCLNAHKEGCIITLSAHMPNFSSKNIVKRSDGTYDFTKCDFMDTKDLSNDCPHELLWGGKYNETFNAYLDMIVEFADALANKNIPIIFRPWHENNGHWFFWGTAIDGECYKNIFRYTKEYMLNHGVTNMLYVYSPNGPFSTKEEYMDRYPGDDVIDIMAFDYYDDYKYKESFRDTFFNEMRQSSKIISELAKEHGKIAAISEVGIRVMKNENDFDMNGLLESGNPIIGHDWFIEIGKIAIENGMPYYLVWGNFEKYNHYLPYRKEDGTLHEFAPEFINFYNWERSIFAEK